MGNLLVRRQVLKAFVAAAAIAGGLLACGGGGGGGGTGVPGVDGGITPTPQPQSSFYASWTAAPLDGTGTLPGRPAPGAETFDNQTLRQVVRLSLAGDTVRVRISNRFGKAAATFSAVRVARSPTGGSEIDTSTDRAVTFGGQASVTLAPGAELNSDAVNLPVAQHSYLAVSMYFAGPTPMPTMHPDGRQLAYIVPGNHLSDASIQAAGQDLRESYFGLVAVESSSTQSTKVVVAFGDSLTDGLGSTMNAAKRYPNQLDDRLKAAGFARTGVVNAGISGNRWLNEFAGPTGNSRFERDVLEVAGVTHTIILLGINDIAFSVEPAPGQQVTSQQIIDSIAAAVNKAHARGVKVLLGTLMPFKGASNYSDDGEIKRQTVNAWIRGNPDVAGVIDFDAALRNPANPAVLNPLYDSGDHVHPNEAGYAAMAAAVDLGKL